MLPALLTTEQRSALVSETLGKQSADGGWTLDALGPWMTHPDAPAHQGSDAYATAFTAFALHKAGIRANHPAMTRALDWLKAKQDPSTGAWPAVSMNKQRPAGSMEAQFMQDAATAFASLVLLDTGQ